MKTAAGIAGILLGIFSLTYVGIFGSMVGSAAGLLGAIPFRGNTLGPWAEMVSMLSWLAPLATIAGGIVTFSNPRVGGIILGASAFLHWYLLGFGQAGKLFVLPIGVTAALALFASSSTRPATNLAGAQTSSEPPSHSNTAGPSFDRTKWNALVQYDKDIASMTEKLQPLGQKWLDEFASSYLALNDKTYLPEIERKILAAAKVEAEENERQRIYWEEQRKVSLQEQERLAQESALEQARAAEARRKQIELWKERLWGTSQRKLRTVCFFALAAAIISATAWWVTAPVPVKTYVALTTDPAFNTKFSIWLWKEGGKYVGQMKLHETSDFGGPTGELENILVDDRSGRLSFQSSLRYCITDPPRPVSFEGKLDLANKTLIGSLNSPKLHFDDKSTLRQCCEDAPAFKSFDSLIVWKQSWATPDKCLPQ